MIHVTAEVFCDFCEKAIGNPQKYLAAADWELPRLYVRTVNRRIACDECVMVAEKAIEEELNKGRVK